jgi:hypothetical protein
MEPTGRTVLEAERLRARALVRSHVRTTIALALFAGLAAGVALGIWAIARETAGAYDRFVESVDQGDGGVFGCHPGLTEEEISSAFAELCSDYDYADVLELYADAPEIQAAGRWTYALSHVARADDPSAGWRQLVPVAIDEAVLETFGSPIVVAGRRADPNVATEATVNEELAERLELVVGDRLVVTPYRRDEFDLAGEGRADAGGTATTVEVVGIERWPSDLAGRLGGTTIYDDASRLLLGPAWWELIEGDAASYGIGVGVELIPGVEPERMLELLIERWPDRVWQAELGQYFGQDGGESVVDAIDLQALSVGVMAIVIGCAAVLFVGQTIARQSRREWDDTAILAALGMSRRQRCAAAALRAVPVASIAAAVAGAVAIALAQAGPVGIARAADTSSGLQIDAGVLLIGLPLAVIAVVACAVAPVWRGHIIAPSSVRRPVPAPVAAASPPALAGWGFTTARRAGRLALASAVVGTIAATAAGVAALAVTSSYEDLLAHPARLGSAWDATVGNVGSEQQEIDTRAALAAIPGIDVTGITTLSGIGGDPSFGLVASVPFLGERRFDTVVEGRAPQDVSEVALGARSMEKFEVEIGDEVTFGDPSAPGIEFTFTVVGEAVINDSLTSRPGTGALLTAEAAGMLSPETPSQVYAVWVDADADREETLAALRDAFPTTYAEVSVPMQVRNLGLVDDQPLLVALIIGVLAGAALIHTLITSVRSSRRQIGVLRALGFTRGQVSTSVAWHATAIAGAGLLVGIPLGIVTGRLLWRWIVDDLGLESPATVPALAVLSVGAIVLVAANVASFVPGRLAANMRAANALRVE